MGGIAEAVCLQPIDVIKTRLQLDNKGYYKGACALAAAAAAAAPPAWRPCQEGQQSGARPAGGSPPLWWTHEALHTHHHGRVMQPLAACS
jgi:hypothetical protein